MEMIKTKRNQLIDAVRSIPSVADKEHWVLTLDKEEGTLFYSPETIPDGTELHQVTDEYALYVDKEFNPKGVMVEYYNANFVKHHDLFEKLSKGVFVSKDSVDAVDPKKGKNDDAMFLKALLERTLIKEADIGFAPA